MKKKALLLASMGALACTVGITALAVGGANHLDAFPVKADPTKYSVTFNESNTSSEVVDVYGQEFIVFTTATDNGNKVGMVGCYNDEASFTFKGASFMELCLFDIEDVLVGRAYEFSTITGFAISFSVEEPEPEPEPEPDPEPEPVIVNFESMDEHIFNVVSGKPYEVPSITPYKSPSFMIMEGNVTITSLTISYSC